MDPQAWLRMGRSLIQNAAAAAAASVVVVGDGADLKTLGMSGGTAALAAVLAYLHNVIRPAGGGKLGDVVLRANRSLWQNLLSAAVVAAAAAVASAGSMEPKALGLLALQAGGAALLSGLYNAVRPLAPSGDDGGDSAGR
ncbi:hypothetical protein ETD86_30080 [Nonomuraea turkmeniaca]|uniref:Holin n=1 Tax=Nonomuraea turkmeniaca TaxID=103838 RepID=A0A5S4F9X0_9ACTN|nr:hypothetical protein [Nonomuraea turkmeniaca]TMR13815.1 hypothetical protein ETD86_30080 [Nonomuraea turkmeniaca]